MARIDSDGGSLAEGEESWLLLFLTQLWFEVVVCKTGCVINYDFLVF